jgi:hypothetical protein
MITGKLYNQLKFLAQVILPALATLYVTLAGLWGLPAVEAVVGSIVALDTFLGVILQISSSNYDSSTSQGTMHFLDTPNKLTYQLELDGDPEELKHKDRVVLKVRNAATVVPVAKAKPKAKARSPRANTR